MAVVAGTATVTSGFNQTVSSGVVTTQTIPASVSLTTQYANGTGAGKVDLIHARQLTLAGSATTLDLTALTDLSGAAANFARVRELVVQVVTATGGFDLTLGNAASNAWAAFWGATAFAWIIAVVIGAIVQGALTRATVADNEGHRATFGECIAAARTTPFTTSPFFTAK